MGNSDSKVRLATKLKQLADLERAFGEVQKEETRALLRGKSEEDDVPSERGRRPRGSRRNSPSHESSSDGSVVNSSGSDDSKQEKELKADIRKLKADIRKLEKQLRQHKGPIEGTESHHPTAPPLPPLYNYQEGGCTCLRCSRSLSDEHPRGVTFPGLYAYPVTEVTDQQGQVLRQHKPLTFKDLKQLKEAVSSYGAQAPFTLAIVESYQGSFLTPSDWQQLCRAVLAGGDYLLWRSEYQERCIEAAWLNAQTGRGQVNVEMLTGVGQYAALVDQITYDAGTYAQIATAALRAWKSLPNTGAGEQITKVLQGPSEPYADFVSRLLQLAGRIFGDIDQAMPIIKQLAFENANKYCKEALRGLKGKSLNDMLRACRDIDATHIQAQVMAAAIARGLWGTRGGNGARSRGCFQCGQMGHVKRDCPNGPGQGGGSRPGICWKCKKKGHWSSECRSRWDKDGNPLPSGNRGRGLPRVPKTRVYGVMRTTAPVPGSERLQHIPVNNPFTSGSPRMSQRSLHLVTTATYSSGDSQAVDTHISINRATHSKEKETRTVKQRRSASKPAFKRVSSSTSHGSTSGLRRAMVLRHPVLDEPLIREQTKVDHFWGLHDDGDLKGGNKAATQGNGELAAEVTASNRYTCRDCRMLSARTDACTAHSAIHGTTSRVYSRDRTLKQLAEAKAASGTFWWLGSGWYQFVTLILWLNVFLLTRCLRKVCKVLVLLLPLLLLLGAGLSLWGQGSFLSLQPMLNRTAIQPAQRVGRPEDVHSPGPLLSNPPLKVDFEASQWPQESDMGQKVASLSAQCHNHEERLAELTVLLQKLQMRVDQVDDGREGLSLWVKEVVEQHLQELGATEPLGAKTDFMTFHHDHEVRLSNLEKVLQNITHHITVTGQSPTSEAIVSAMSEAGISGITEAQAHIIVSNALKLYSQDKTGMVDFALESGGGSILSTQCSETYEIKTALLRLSGIPL